MLKIQPTYLTLWSLLSDRLFRIPEYQRAYSWTTHQRADLFEDIRKTYKRKNTVHFMAAIVALRRSTRSILTDDFFVTEIVDGQQRITTLILLLKALQLNLDKSDKLDSRLYDEIQDLLVKPDEDSLLLLQTNHDTSHYFKNYLLKGKHPDIAAAKTVADKQLLSAMKECEEFVEMWKSNKTLPTLLALLKNQLAFILHEIDDETVVYTVFEVLNSRGLEVSWLDRLKSVLMGILCELCEKDSDDAAEHLKELQNIWKDIYHCIGLRQGMNEEALRFSGTFLEHIAPSKIVSESVSVDSFRKEASTISKIKENAHHLLEVTKSVDKTKENRRVNAVTKIVQARFLAVAINSRDDLEAEERRRLLQQWEATTFRIYGLYRKDARTAVGDYVRLAWRVYNEKIDYRSILDGLINIGANYPVDGDWPEVAEGDWYNNWADELRYFFYRYEEYLSTKAGQNFNNEQWNRIWEASASNSIEHIWPQSKAPEKHVHRLGNLVLLPPKLNSKLKNKSAKDKNGDYRDIGLLIAKKVSEALDNSPWNVGAIIRREEILINWARAEWGDIEVKMKSDS